MRSVVPAIVFVALLLFAGCLGGGGTPAPDPSATPTATQTPTEQPTTWPSPTETADPGTVVAYSELNSQQQDAFRAAIDGEVSFVPNTSYVSDSAGYDFEHVDPFREHDYVRYDGDRYRISTHAGELYASYQIRASVGTPGANATVVALEELPDSVREEVRTAVTEGEYSAPLGKWDSLPEPLQNVDYVSHDGETYEMGYAVGDAWARVMTVGKVE